MPRKPGGQTTSKRKRPRKGLDDRAPPSEKSARAEARKPGATAVGSRASAQKEPGVSRAGRKQANLVGEPRARNVLTEGSDATRRVKEPELAAFAEVEPRAKDLVTEGKKRKEQRKAASRAESKLGPRRRDRLAGGGAREQTSRSEEVEASDPGVAKVLPRPTKASR